jgi:hypothetical protein
VAYTFPAPLPVFGTDPVTVVQAVNGEIWALQGNSILLSLLAGGTISLAARITPAPIIVRAVPPFGVKGAIVIPSQIQAQEVLVVSGVNGLLVLDPATSNFDYMVQNVEDTIFDFVDYKNRTYYGSGSELLATLVALAGSTGAPPATTTARIMRLD